MKTILCFGDSNTYGTMPMESLDADGRFDETTRWPSVMRAALGDEFRVIEEGLPGRTTVWDDPIEGAHRNGTRMLLGLIESHRPVDLLIIMLGTNDHKLRFGIGAEDIALGVRRLVDIAKASEKVRQILVIAPPRVLERGCLAAMFQGAEAKSPHVAMHLKAVTQSSVVHFLDAGAVIESDPLDGVHFSAESQKRLGQEIASRVQDIFAQSPE